METIIINNKKYQVMKNYKDALNVEELKEKLTEYFDDFDYIVGDIAYSKLSFEENLKQTKELVKYAHKKNVFVEAELGKIFGNEDLVTNNESAFTDPIKAREFIRLTNVDALAISVGTSHGAYKLKVVNGLQQNLIKQISSDNPQTILVLHGASHIDKSIVSKINKLGGELKSTNGISIDDELLAITNGITKINIDSDLRLAYTYGLRKFLNENKTAFDIRKITQGGIDELKKECEKKISLFCK